MQTWFVTAVPGLNTKRDKQLYSIPPLDGPRAVVQRCSDPRQGDHLLDSVRARLICDAARSILPRVATSTALSASSCLTR